MEVPKDVKKSTSSDDYDLNQEPSTNASGNSKFNSYNLVI